MQLNVGVDEDALEVGAAFDAFFRAHFEKVARAMALLTGDAGTGQDLAQEAFARLFQRWKEMDSEDHARNFAYKVATNLARSHLRKSLRVFPYGLRRSGEPAIPNAMAPRMTGSR